MYSICKTRSNLKHGREVRYSKRRDFYKSETSWCDWAAW